MPPLTALLSRNTKNTSEAQLPLNAQDSSYHPQDGHAYERMPSPQQQHQGESGRRRFDDGDDNDDDDDSEDHVEGNVTSALEQRETVVELRILPAFQMGEGK